MADPVQNGLLMILKTKSEHDDDELKLYGVNFHVHYTDLGIYVLNGHHIL